MRHRFIYLGISFIIEFDKRVNSSITLNKIRKSCLVLFDFGVEFVCVCVFDQIKYLYFWLRILTLCRASWTHSRCLGAARPCSNCQCRVRFDPCLNKKPPKFSQFITNNSLSFYYLFFCLNNRIFYIQQKINKIST
jgi:hypothetical protein